MRQILVLFFAKILLFSCASNDYHKVFELEARNYALINAPVYAWIEDMEFEHDAMVCLYLEDEIVPGQIETLDDSRQRVWWIADLETGDSARYELRKNDLCREEEYQSEKYIWERITEHSSRLFVGEFFPYRLTVGESLTIKYRFWVTEGKVPSLESVDLRYHAFADPSSAIEPR